MPQEFEGDLAQSVFWGADMRGSMFRDVDLTGTRIGHALVYDVEIDAMIDRLVVNGVDVTDYVNQHDRWYPLRAMLRPTTPDQARAAWAELLAVWAPFLERVQALPTDAVHQSVGGEWNLVQTLRHLVFAIDKWFTVPVLGGEFAAIGWPNTGSMDVPFPGLDLGLEPSFEEALAVWNDRCRRFGEFTATLSADDLDREVEVLENGPNPVRECVFTVLEEGFWHLRYASRDLEVLHPAT
jgi:uncharacterized damage-inducible protein DinB